MLELPHTRAREHRPRVKEQSSVATLVGQSLPFDPRMGALFVV
jgi:hypothetical protein